MGSNGFSPDWPAGLRVLVVDRDISSTNNLVKHLKKSSYLVWRCTLAKAALAMLGEKNEEYNFEIVMTDVNMVDMADEFEFLRTVARQLDVPVILMTADGETDTVKKGILNGASGYLHKPIAAKDVCFIWKHVYRKQHFKIVREEGSPSSTNKIVPMAGKNNWELGESSHRGNFLDGDFSSVAKKVRFIWTEEHHMKFERVVAQIKSANEGVTPKKILQLMKEPTLTIEKVASHLQKYRGKNKKVNKYPQQFVPTTPQISDTDMSSHQNMAIYENPFRVPNIAIGENLFPIMTFEEGFNLYHKSGQQLGQPSALQNPQIMPGLQTQFHPHHNVNNDDGIRRNVELNPPQQNQNQNQNQNPVEFDAPQQNLDQNPSDDSYLLYFDFP